MNDSLAVDTSHESTLWPSLLTVLGSEQNVVGKDDLLFRRTDVCTQAFGAGWTTTTCAPSNTLCCLNQNSNYPQCEKYLGAGWCCVAYQSTCYIDIGDTSCDAAGSVPCTELAAGTTSACCLPNTTCASGYNASATYARCNIQQLALQALASPSSSRASTSRTTSTSSTTSLTSTDLAATSSKSTAYSIGPVSITSSTSSALPTQTQQNNGGTTTSLTAGAIAGIAIGPVVAVLLILLVAFFVWRRRSRKRTLENAGPVAQYNGLQPQHGYGPDAGTTYYSSAYDQNNAQSYYGPQEKVEMAATHTEPRELGGDPVQHPNGREPAELDAGPRK